MHSLGEGLGTGGDDKVFLEGEFVPGVATAVDDVEAGYGHGVFGVGVASEFGIVGVKGKFVGGSAGLRAC